MMFGLKPGVPLQPPHAFGVDDIESISSFSLSKNGVLSLDHFYQAKVCYFSRVPKGQDDEVRLLLTMVSDYGKLNS
jgi:hypothetical protein